MPTDDRAHAAGELSATVTRQYWEVETPDFTERRQEPASVHS